MQFLIALFNWIERNTRWVEELGAGNRDTLTIDHSMTPPLPQEPLPPPQPAPKYDWSTPAAARHSVRLICDEMGLTVQQKNDLCATVSCESNFNPKIVHPNVVNGKVSTTDFGIAQINDYWHIGPGKDFPSSQYVLDNPEACIRWMCKQWKAGNAKAWVCYLRGLYQHYS